MAGDNTDDIPLVQLYSKRSAQAAYTTIPQGYGPVEEPDTSRSKNEARLAIRKSRTLPLLQLLTHGTSMLFTAALLTLCARNVYFADVTQSNVNSLLNAFQFVARFHEVIVGASLTSMVVYHLRYELCAAQGVPLGYLTSAYSLSQPQFLFQQGFWSATMGKSRLKRKYGFGLMIILATAIMVLTGPSSAILVVPQLEWWDLKDPFSNTNSYTWLNNTYDDLWPTSIDKSRNPNIAIKSNWCDPLSVAIRPVCPYANFRGITQWASSYLGNWSPPNLTVQAEVGTVRYLTASNISARGGVGYSVATTAMSGITRSIGQMWLRASRNNYSMAKPGRPLLIVSSFDSRNPVRKPLIQIQCSNFTDITNKSGNMEVSYLADRLTGINGTQTPDIAVTVNASNWQDDMDRTMFLWRNLTTIAGGLRVGALVSMSFQNPRLIFGDKYPPTWDAKNNTARGLMTCSLASHWIPTLMSQDRSENVVYVSNPDPVQIVSSPEQMSQARKLDIDLSWLTASNPDVVVQNNGTTRRSVYEFELDALAYDPPYFDGRWCKQWPDLVATVMSMTVADGLARLENGQALMVYHQDLKNSSNSYAESIRDLNGNQYTWYDPTKGKGTIEQLIQASPDLYTPLDWNVQRLGYAWAFERTTKYLAALVVVIHTVLILLHLCFVFWRKWRCDSWENLTELLVLAVQSPRSESLTGVSTSIDDSRTFAEMVQIRESTDKEGESAVLTVGSELNGWGGSFTGVNHEVYSNVYAAGSEHKRLQIGKKYW